MRCKATLNNVLNANFEKYYLNVEHEIEKECSTTSCEDINIDLESDLENNFEYFGLTHSNLLEAETILQNEALENEAVTSIDKSVFKNFKYMIHHANALT